MESLSQPSEIAIFCPENNLVWVYMQKGHNGPHPRPRPKNLNLNLKFKILFLNFNLWPKS